MHIRRVSRYFRFGSTISSTSTPLLNLSMCRHFRRRLCTPVLIHPKTPNPLMPCYLASISLLLSPQLTRKPRTC
ncbi:uncharacterized protein BP01DRAFT_166811 [Aspergillus saccharolyticus JOP 1030-1]|uniref:Uncharacterized protein n=1 Tax=Aspergillus saccharolyticus JOP 1030-1 TaxID=1450539 RepID=A0A318Z9Y1_9EURO|nr:hypothetical protein BP01DRAFT_166811 [Aspergillus saccharolyticus JOP 1030-1]PYH41513.1 hypothetical protein BP01DRAFT_166811 [Aspergillus saccharolyticus JOP 1030-1]